MEIKKAQHQSFDASKDYEKLVEEVSEALKRLQLEVFLPEVK